MSVKSVLEAKTAVEEAAKLGVTPVVEALDDLLEALDDFLEFVADYDEWEAMRERVAYSDDGVPFTVYGPGFSTAKLSAKLGMDKKEER